MDSGVMRPFVDIEGHIKPEADGAALMVRSPGIRFWAPGRCLTMMKPFAPCSVSWWKHLMRLS